MSSAVTFTILAALASVVALLPVVYFEYRRNRLRHRQDEAARPVGLDELLTGGGRKLDDPRLRQLTTYPSEAEGLSSLAALEELSPCAIGNLTALGYDEIDKLSNGLAPGLPVATEDGPSFTRDELGGNGYVEQIASPVVNDPRSWVVLTEEGRRLARILTASRTAPQWLWDASRKRS